MSIRIDVRELALLYPTLSVYIRPDPTCTPKVKKIRLFPAFIFLYKSLLYGGETDGA